MRLAPAANAAAVLLVDVINQSGGLTRRLRLAAEERRWMSRPHSAPAHTHTHSAPAHTHTGIYMHTCNLQNIVSVFYVLEFDLRLVFI